MHHEMALLNTVTGLSMVRAVFMCITHGVYARTRCVGVDHARKAGARYRTEKEQFVDTPLSTEGARRYGGRGDPPGVGILYSTASLEPAMLERLVHLPILLNG